MTPPVKLIRQDDRCPLSTASVEAVKKNTDFHIKLLPEEFIVHFQSCRPLHTDTVNFRRQIVSWRPALRKGAGRNPGKGDIAVGERLRYYSICPYCNIGTQGNLSQNFCANSDITAVSDNGDVFR